MNSFGRPGVIRQGKGVHAYGTYRKDEVVGVNLTSNRAAVGVGFLARSSDDLYMCGGVGVCVQMIHVFGDKLWTIESAMCLQIPFIGAAVQPPKDGDFPELAAHKAVSAQQPPPPPQQKQQPTIKYQAPAEHFPALGMDAKRKQKPDAAPPIPCDDFEELRVTESPLASDLLKEVDSAPASASSADEDDSDGEAEPVVEEESEDDVLRRAFLTALKRDGKQLTIPLLTSTFYRCNVVPAADRNIDLKKTTHKKLSKFLAVMAADRFITVREEQKGVEKIVAVNLLHPDLVEFVARAPVARDGGSAADTEAASLFVTEMTELYVVTDEVARFFARFNVANGQGIEKTAVKKLLKEYVCNQKLQDPANSQVIHCNEALLEVCSGGGAAENSGQSVRIEFDRLVAIILSKMKHSFEMRSRNEIKSSKNPIIQMQLATRSGNKKVTLVNNLEAYGIRLSEFEKACKIGVAASTTVTKLANQKGEQLLVQGNQIRFIHKLLTTTYKVPAKNIVGIDLAKKEKKPAAKKK